MEYIVRFFLKVKGIKKIFSSDPIPYHKLRKDDLFSPSKRILRGQEFDNLKIHESEITVIKPASDSGKLIIYCPGGAFVCGPSALAFQNIALIVEKTKSTAWLVNYPKAPENGIQTISKNIDAVYTEALKQYSESDIILLGGSAGGNLILTLTQRLIKNKMPCPSKLIAVCPVAEASLCNPEIDNLEKTDPVLSKNGLLSANRMAAGNLSLKDEILSPLYGSFDNFPETYLFAAEQDILTPDILLMYEKMKKESVNVQLMYGKKMIHIWPFIPFLKKSSSALNVIINSILSSGKTE
jgi:acetyl esterase/lipase